MKGFDGMEKGMIIDKNLQLSKPDSRDYTLETVGIPIATSFPDEFIIKELPNIYDQYSSSMCVAFALSEIKESQEIRERGRRIRFSPAFVYAEKDCGNAEGMTTRHGLKTIQKYGICPFEDFPYIGSYEECKKEYNKNKTELLEKAFQYRINTYFSLRSDDEIKTCLMENGAVSVVVEVWNNFNYTRKDGIVDVPKALNKYLGLHAMIIIGWRKINNRDYWIVQNSYGTSFGDKGYCYISFTNPILREFWGVTDYIPENLPLPKKQVVMWIGSKNIEVNAVKKEMDVAPMIKDSSTLVPLRFVAENLGGRVEFDHNNKTAIVLTKDKLIKLPVNQNHATVDGKKVSLSAPSIIHEGRTLIPLRFVSEQMGYQVDWINSEKKIVITEK